VAVQIGHAGPKGSTCAPWEGAGADRPLPDGNWPLLAASAQPYLPDGAVPRAMTRADMDRVTADFVAATRRAAEAGFDWLELHCAHGYLLSSFISPLDQPPHRRVRRQPGPTGCATRWRSSPPCAPPGRAPAPVGAHLGARLGRRRHHPRRRGADRARLQGVPAPT
jgi:hypothetical protein